MSPSLRKPLLTFHVWSGFTTGVVLLIVAVTGTFLIFRTALERRLDEKRFVVEATGARLPMDELVSKAVAAHPSATFLSVRYYGDPTMPFLALFSDATYVHLNPHTGEVLGVRKRYGEGFGWIEGLHKYLIFGTKVGEYTNGCFAFLYLAMLIAGIVVWLPATRRALKAGLTLNWKLKGRAWSLNVHKTVGIYAAAFLMFSAATGITISFESTRAILDFITASKRDLPPARPAAKQNPFVGFEVVSKKIAALMPNARETYIALPKQGLVSSYAIASDAPHPNARSYVWFSSGDAEIIRFSPYAKTSAGYRLYYWLLSLHTAVAGGPIVFLMLLFGTLSVPLLTWTGTVAYLRRKARKTAAAPNPGAEAFALGGK